ALLVSRHKKDTGREKVDCRLLEKLISSSGRIRFLKGLKNSFCCFRSIGHCSQIPSVHRIDSSGIFYLVQIDHMEFEIWVFLFVLSFQIVEVGNLSQIREFKIVKTHGESFANHLSNK